MARASLNLSRLAITSLLIAALAAAPAFLPAARATPISAQLRCRTEYNTAPMVISFCPSDTRNTGTRLTCLYGGGSSGSVAKRIRPGAISCYDLRNNVVALPRCCDRSDEGYRIAATFAPNGAWGSATTQSVWNLRCPSNTLWNGGFYQCARNSFLPVYAAKYAASMDMYY